MDVKTYQNWEQLSDHVYRKWINDNKIVIYKALNASRKSVDAWADGILQTYETWDIAQPYLAIYDVATIMAMTPYTRFRVKDLVESAQTKRIHGRYAIVISNMAVSNIMRLFVRRELDRQNADFVREFFRTQEDAISWLKQSQ